MIDFEFKPRYGLSDLYDIIEILRSPGGCPWDIEQTHSSIKNGFIEEVYEVADAIDREDSASLCEELGDVLLQVYFHASISNSRGEFSIDDVADGVCKKLIYRHPHVFGDASVSGSAQVLDNWDKLKRTEKNQSTYTDTLKSVPKSFPALMRAAKVQKRAGKSDIPLPGFDCSEEELKNRLHSLVDEISSENGDKLRLFGNILFLLTRAARTAGVDLEEALNSATDEFISGFAEAETHRTPPGGAGA